MKIKFALLLLLCPLLANATTFSSTNYQINAGIVATQAVASSSPGYVINANLGVTANQEIMASTSYKIATSSSSTITQPLYTVTDALMALKIAVGLDTPTPAQMTRYDLAPIVNGVSEPNGAIDITDAMVVLRLAVGLPM